MSCLLMLLLALTFSACTLTALPPGPPDDAPPENTPNRVSNVPTARPGTLPTANPSITAQPSASPTVRAATSTPAPTRSRFIQGCVPNGTWPQYTVQRGDTLISIAGDVNSSVDELARANCLNDTNLIMPGQTLRVPRLPGPPTLPPPVNAGYVAASPYLIFDANGYALQPSTSVGLSWPEARRDAQRVDFFLIPVGGGSAALLGTDLSPGDGANLAWTTPASGEGLLYANAILPGGQQQTTIGTVRFQIGAPTGRLVIAPYLRLDGERTLIAPNQNTTLSWPNAPTQQALRAEFYLELEGPLAPVQQLGSDTYFGDGVNLTYNFGISGGGKLSARLVLNSGATLNTDPLRFSIEAAPDTPSGQVEVAPYLVIENNVWLLQKGAAVTLSWPQSPGLTAARIEFYFTPAGAGTSPQLLGTDTVPVDGATLSWTVPDTLEGTISAQAVNAGGSVVSRSGSIAVRAS